MSSLHREQVIYKYSPTNIPPPSPWNTTNAFQRTSTSHQPLRMGGPELTPGMVLIRGMITHIYFPIPSTDTLPPPSPNTSVSGPSPHGLAISLSPPNERENSNSPSRGNDRWTCFRVDNKKTLTGYLPIAIQTNLYISVYCDISANSSQQQRNPQSTRRGSHDRNPPPRGRNVSRTSYTICRVMEITRPCVNRNWIADVLSSSLSEPIPRVHASQIAQRMIQMMERSLYAQESEDELFDLLASSFPDEFPVLVRNYAFHGRDKHTLGLFYGGDHDGRIQSLSVSVANRCVNELQGNPFLCFFESASKVAHSVRELRETDLVRLRTAAMMMMTSSGGGTAPIPSISLTDSQLRVIRFYHGALLSRKQQGHTYISRVFLDNLLPDPQDQRLLLSTGSIVPDDDTYSPSTTTAIHEGDESSLRMVRFFTHSAVQNRNIIVRILGPLVQKLPSSLAMDEPSVDEDENENPSSNSHHHKEVEESPLEEEEEEESIEMIPLTSLKRGNPITHQTPPSKCAKYNQSHRHPDHQEDSSIEPFYLSDHDDDDEIGDVPSRTPNGEELRDDDDDDDYSIGDNNSNDGDSDDNTEETSPTQLLTHELLQKYPSLSVDQVRAITLYASLPLIFILGGPGVGKSYLTRILSKLWRMPEFAESRGKFLCMTSMGSAALRTESFTGQCRPIRWYYEKWSGSEKFRNHVQQKYHSILIDESSVLTERDLAMALEILPNLKSLVLVGDPDQMPPITDGYPFLDLLSKYPQSIVRLTTNHRLNPESGDQLQRLFASIRDDHFVEFLQCLDYTLEDVLGVGGTSKCCILDNLHSLPHAIKRVRALLEERQQRSQSSHHREGSEMSDHDDRSPTPPSLSCQVIAHTNNLCEKISSALTATPQLVGSSWNPHTFRLHDNIVFRKNIYPTTCSSSSSSSKRSTASSFEKEVNPCDRVSNRETDQIYAIVKYTINHLRRTNGIRRQLGTNQESRGTTQRIRAHIERDPILNQCLQKHPDVVIQQMFRDIDLDKVHTEFLNQSLRASSASRKKHHRYAIITKSEGKFVDLETIGADGMQRAEVITGSSSQGKEWDVVCIVIEAHISRFFTRDLLFTMATRARTFVIILSEAPRSDLRTILASGRPKRYCDLQSFLPDPPP